MFNKILFPTDGSDNSKKALKYVKNLGEKYNATVVAIHAYDLPIIYTEEIEDYLKESGMSILKETEIELAELNVKTRLIKGSTGKSIVEYASQESCDIIIMGSHGLSQFQGILLGSISNYVIHHSKIPVMLV